VLDSVSQDTRDLLIQGNGAGGIQPTSKAGDTISTKHIKIVSQRETRGGLQYSSEIAARFVNRTSEKRPICDMLFHGR
jgi:hypothetical protein